jgi:N-acyl-D-amino-acid deacylase
MADVLFERARVVDGTGAPWFRGAVAVEDGTIAAVSRASNPDVDADVTVDLEGDVLCPGFVDTHSHSDLMLFDTDLSPKARQGITTEILGQDGFSMAPMYRDGGADEWQRQLRALEGDVDVEWTWGSVADYLDAIDEAGPTLNVGVLVGHGTARFNVLGMADRSPTDDELVEMADLVTEGLEDGAVGFSTGLIYTPSTYAETAEVKQLAARLGPYGRPFVAHVRSEGRWLWDALDEFVDVGAETGVPLHVSHFKVAGTEQQGKAERALHLVETARDRGVDLTVEQYPYTAASTMLSVALPPWVHADGPEGVLAYLTDDEARDRIHEDVERWRIDGWENFGALAGWENLVVSNVESEENADLEGMSIADVAAARDVRATDAVCDLLVEEELGVSIVAHMLDEDDVRTILSHERVCVATDGLFGGKPHPRVYGTYPRILETYVREENLLTLESAVRKMTSLPARAMGLDRKGIVRPGMDADLVVFDPTTVSTPATFETPRRHPTGIHHVLVDGEFVVRDGEMTGSAPGRAIRAGVE